jgi:hypothetical protein
VRRYARKWPAWLESVVCGAVFFGVLVAVQWPFADFLMTPAAANAFFGTIYRDYGTSAKSHEALNIFYPSETGFGMRMLIALVVAMVTARIGLGWGNWMRTVKR